MDSLSEVSAYLNELENVLDDGDSPMKVEELVDVGTKMERIDAMDVIENVSKKVKNEVVVSDQRLPNQFRHDIYLFIGSPVGSERYSPR
ncbi:hypothetical protein Tco_1352381 [Tanacetum coccineum]